MKSLPEQLKNAHVFSAGLEAVYGPSAARAIVAQLAQRSRASYWFNPLLCADPTSQTPPVPSEPIAELPQMWSAAADSGLSTTEAASEGRIYIQNPSSVLAVRVLAPLPDEEILDLAAAPGGKTIAIAAAMGNTGRFHRMRANVARCGVTSVDFYQRDGRGVGRAVPQRFDRVLLDAPCSSEARMRWYDVNTYTHWSRQKVKETQRKQKSLLRSAYAALKPGGVMVYCTCSFSVEENERVVHHLLTRSDAVVESITHPLPSSVPGVTQWQGKALAAELENSVRILPTSTWDGFYLARLRKP